MLNLFGPDPVEVRGLCDGEENALFVWRDLLTFRDVAVRSFSFGRDSDDVFTYRGRTLY